MKRLTIFIVIVLGGMGIAFTVARRINADHNGHSVVVDTESMTKVLNDSGEALRINGSLVNPGQTWSGGGQTVTIFVPSKGGTFKLSGELLGANVKFSEIKKSVGSGKVDAFDIHTARGRIDGIEVEYEALPYGAD